ncbi:MAG: CBS domain-containing protein [Candidatus Omnitrophica bacterium]|nr:CBS domain-containing protein [Candidatus Omnitrophota bacterium]MCM8799813.1 CBS domain-containing protein [Candidatus Omnitrophota bacterium]
MKVKEIMKKEVVSLSKDTKIKDAFGKLLQIHISGLPVLDENLRIVGMFTEKDILRAILPGYLEKVGRFIYEENPKIIQKKLLDIQDLTVEKLMRKDVITVDEDTTLCEVARIMLTQNVRRIPVLDKEKRVIGIVAREDIIKAYAKEARWITD